MCAHAVFLKEPSNDDWLKIKEWNSQGIFPAENESFEIFSQRAASYVGKSTHFLGMQQYLTYDEKQKALEIVKKIYDIDPQWVPMCYSFKGLYVWEGACTWIEKDLSSVSIQLTPFFQKHSSLFGLYSKDEVIAHEYIHAARACFDESQCEELFSYYITELSPGFSGKNTYLALFQSLGGAFISTKYAIHVAVVLCVMFCMLLIGDSIFDRTTSILLFSGCILVSVLYFSYIAYTFCMLRKRWKKCHMRLSSFYKNSQTQDLSLAVMLRLCDAEIYDIADSAIDISEWFKTKRQDCLRLQMIYNTYIKKCK